MGERLVKEEVFSVRDRIRRWKSLSGFFHLLTMSGLVLSLLWMFPRIDSKSLLQATEELRERQGQRQLLVEALDKFVRYEKYYAETHGRYTRDLSRLRLPTSLTGGSRAEVREHYEISVIEAYPNRFLILATGINSADRATIDESNRLTANFVLPPPSRAYLFEEADRMLKLQAQNSEPSLGVFSRYWQVTAEEGSGLVVAKGLRPPVLGERREWKAQPNPLFEAVSGQLKNRLEKGGSRVPASIAHEEPGYPGKTISPFHEVLNAQDVREWLEAGRYAQHVYLRENGKFAHRWEDLDSVSDFHFADRMQVAKNIRVHPVELSRDQAGFRLTLEGTEGDLMGEQFVTDQEGAIRQVRYTEALIHQLQETTNILQNAFQFQINPIVEETQSPQP
jgi:hypothetical protein